MLIAYPVRNFLSSGGVSVIVNAVGGAVLEEVVGIFGKAKEIIAGVSVIISEGAGLMLPEGEVLLEGFFRSSGGVRDGELLPLSECVGE